MPSALPVPSKSALRALRNIALGTSCTVAFSTGMLTEDRRRRIHGAKLVHDNAKKLRSSRQYHDSNVHLADTFEEQVSRYKDDGFWEAGRSTALSNAQSSEVVVAVGQTAGKMIEPVNLIPPSIPFKPPRIEKLRPPPIQESNQNPTDIDEDRQLRLANDIQQILGHEEGSVAVESALRRFLEVFEEGLDMGSSGMQSCLLEAAIVLSTACRISSRMEDMGKILDIVLESTTLSETDFKRFEPHIIIGSLLQSSVDEAGQDADSPKLRKASTLCLVEFKEKPGPISNKMKPVTVEACNLTCRYSMYELTKQLFWRIEATRGKTPNSAVGSFIIAELHTKQYRSAIRFFRNFIETSPSQEELYLVADALVESALERKQFTKVEQVLIEVAKLTKRDHFMKSNNWLQKLLGTEWRRKRNIRETQERFDRLKTVIPVICRPQAAYAVIIQLCVEAGDFVAAGNYHEQLNQISGPCEDDILIRGQIARGKAMCEEWDDVKSSFAEMAKLKPNNRVYGDIFPPILKLFAKSHSLAETEDFLQCFLQQYQVPLTPYASNIMIGEYAKAKELQSIIRWIEYATSVSTFLDADSFNTILSQLYKTWGFNFEEVYQVHRVMLRSSVDYTNDSTLAYLRQLALKDSKGIQEVATRKLRALPSATRAIKDDNYPRRQIFEESEKGNFKNVVDIYEDACKKGVYIHSSVLAATVKALLHLNDGDSYMALQLIRDAKLKGYSLDDALITILTHRLPKFMESAGSSRLIKFLTSAREAIAKAQEYGITVPQYVFNEVTNILVQNGYFQDAIAFWAEMSRTYSATVRPDVVSLTILLKAYIGIKESSGIIWITKMLSVNQIVPDARMKQILKNTRTILRKEKLSSRLSSFLQVIEEAFLIYAMIRGEDQKDRKDARGKTLEIMDRALDAQRSVSEQDITPETQEIDNWDEFDDESTNLAESNQDDEELIAESSF
ncbi:hypothetical protein SBOR_5412 [Sclerotinia borealis F-4128]|uniref:Pentatricopeptide repeat protein n=1 Tax=Sclerotinia borealis (strain F-4128) TaxID=1432307 RepID=W9CE91_SCLBF|nr:hypothetical protein SBOR_5412 [Sclerotinia borealis F-4128]